MAGFNLKGLERKKDRRLSQKEDVLGVCLVAKKVSRGSERELCTGNVVRDLQTYSKKIFLITTENIAPKKELDDLKERRKTLNTGDYKLYFLTGRDNDSPKTYELEGVTNSDDPAIFDSGLAIIPIASEKLKRTSSLNRYRPFAACKDVADPKSLGGSICRIVEGSTKSFNVKSYNVECNGGEYVLSLPEKDFSYKTLSHLTARGAVSNLHPFGAGVFKNKKVVAVLNFVNDKIFPVRLSEVQLSDRPGPGTKITMPTVPLDLNADEESTSGKSKLSDDSEMTKYEEKIPAQKDEPSTNGKRQAGESGIDFKLRTNTKDNGLKKPMPSGKNDSPNNRDDAPLDKDGRLNQLDNDACVTKKRSCDKSYEKTKVNQPNIGNENEDSGETKKKNEIPASGNPSDIKAPISVGDLEFVALEKGFEIDNNQGEGNCMFLALSQQLELVHGMSLSHQQLRNDVVDYLENNASPLGDSSELFPFVSHCCSSFEEYLEKMRQDGTWGDNVILQAAAECYKTCIWVISDQGHDRDTKISPRCGADESKVLVLGHVREFHYVSLRPNQESTSSNSPLTEGSKKKDDISSERKTIYHEPNRDQKPDTAELSIDSKRQGRGSGTDWKGSTGAKENDLKRFIPSGKDNSPNNGDDAPPEKDERVDQLDNDAGVTETRGCDNSYDKTKVPQRNIPSEHDEKEQKVNTVKKSGGPNEDDFQSTVPITEKGLEEVKQLQIDLGARADLPEKEETKKEPHASSEIFSSGQQDIKFYNCSNFTVNIYNDKKPT